MLPLSLQTENQGTSDSSLKCQERKKRGGKTGKRRSTFALVSLWVANYSVCCSEKVSKGRIDLICELCDPQ